MTEGDDDMIKRGVSKNYFHWESYTDGKIYDQRLVDKSLEEKKEPKESAFDPNNIDTKILVYEDRVKGWFLEIAGKLKTDNEAGFVILQIALSYLEGNQQYRKGENSRNNSEVFFKESLKRIFPELCIRQNIDRLLHNFYVGVRCGLFHDGMTRRFVTISGEFSDALSIHANEIKINPHKFLDKITEDFDEYITELKDTSNTVLRRNFENIWSVTG